MKKAHPLPLIVLTLLLMVPAADSARAVELMAQTMLEINYTWEYYGEVQGVQLGYAVAGAGDVDGDGKADILVGAANGGVSKEGQALLFLGDSNGPHDVPDWQALGEHQGDNFGAALDGAGDVNGDGWDDLLVGAAHYTVSNDQAGEGAAYAFYGGEDGPSLTADWKVEGDLKDARLGAAVAGAGDINGDGFDDVIVGMPGYAYDTFTNAGAALVYFGAEDGLETAYRWSDRGLKGGDQFGMAVSGAGDVNGDGHADVLVAAPNYDHIADFTYVDAGMVNLYLGNDSSLSNVPAWSYIGYRGGDRLGTSVASAGDVNGDGCDDIVIGAPGYDVGSLLNTGKVYVFYGCRATGSGLNNTPDWEYTFTQAEASFGIDVSSGGDTNDDGYDELLVGAHLYDDEQANEGVVLAFFGGSGGLALAPGWQAEGNKNDTDFGFAVDGAGDTNGDGLSDVLIGAPGFRIGELIKGAAFVYLGSYQAIIYHTQLPLIRK